MSVKPGVRDLRLCALYSGGKDSTLALMKAQEEHEIVCLVTLAPRSLESWLFHYPNVHIVKLQAEAVGLPLIFERCSDDEASSLTALESALARALEAYSVEGIVSGAVRSVYQLSRFKRVADKLGLKCVTPLWGRDEVELLREVVEKGIEAIFTRVAGYPLRKALLGKRIDDEVIDLLQRYRGYVNPSGEGGEYETLVLDAPIFSRRIVPRSWHIEGGEYDAVLVVEEAELVEK